MTLSLFQYGSGIFNAAIARRTEGFTDGAGNSSTSIPSVPQIFSSVGNLYASIPILFFMHLTAMFIYGAGAAKLSYCYQMATSPHAPLLYMYVALAFFFSPIYYPYYALILTPFPSGRR